MEEARKILRRSIHAFLQSYHLFTAAASALAFPSAVAFLLSHPFSSFLLSSFHPRQKLLFHPAGFLSSSFSISIVSSVLTLPFSLTFSLLSRAYVIKLLAQKRHSGSADPTAISVYYFCLLRTFVCSSFLLLSAIASVFGLFFSAFSLLQVFGFSPKSIHLTFSALAPSIYSFIFINARVISNLALVSAASERSSSAHMAILKAVFLIRGRISIALALALPTTLGLAGIKALFQYRIVKAYYAGNRDIVSLALEGLLVAYLHAIFTVLDTVLHFHFYCCCMNDREERVFVHDSENDANDGKACS